MNFREFAYWATGRALPLVMGRWSEENARSIGIIVAHGVHDEARSARTRAPSSSVSWKVLESNMSALPSSFSFISMDEAVSMLNGAAPWRERCLVLTFDDSLKCFAELVAPRLSRLGIPATFYISTDAVENQRPYWWLRLDSALARADDRKVSVTFPGAQSWSFDPSRPVESARDLKKALKAMSAADCAAQVSTIEAQVGFSLLNPTDPYPYAELMSWDNVRQLIRLGMTVGSHTVSHPNLCTLPPEALRLELELSRRILAAQTQVDCRHFCYPYGAHGKAISEAVQAAGYASAVTTMGPGLNRRGDNLWLLKRFALPGERYKLPYLISGLGGVMPWRRRSSNSSSVVPNR